MKTFALFQQYIWLVNTIHKAENGITLEEINQRWLDTDASEGIPIARSTFNRHHTDPGHPAERRDEMDRPQRLFIHEALH